MASFNIQFIFWFSYEPLLMEKSIQSHIVEWHFANSIHKLCQTRHHLKFRKMRKMRKMMKRTKVNKEGNPIERMQRDIKRSND